MKIDGKVFLKSCAKAKKLKMLYLLVNRATYYIVHMLYILHILYIIQLGVRPLHK